MQEDIAGISRDIWLSRVAYPEWGDYDNSPWLETLATDKETPEIYEPVFTKGGTGDI